MAESAGRNWRGKARNAWLTRWCAWSLPRWPVALGVGLAGVIAPAAGVRAEARAPAVLLAVPDAEPSPAMAALQRVLVSRLSEIGVAVRLSAAPFRPFEPAAAPSSPQDVLAFIWVDTQPDSIAVRFYEAAGGHLRERRIPVASIDAASIEEVAIVVRSAVGALLERNRRSASNLAAASGGVQELDVSRSSDSGAPGQAGGIPDTGNPRERGAPSHPLRVSVSYVGQAYASALRWNHGVAMGLAWQGWANGLSLGVSYTWVAPVELRTEQLEVTLRRHPGELILGWEAPLWQPWLKLRPEAALGGEAVLRHSRGLSSQVEAAGKQRRWAWTASGRLALVVVASSGWQGFVAAGADCLLSRFSYELAGEGGGTLIEPRRIRPVVHGGVAVEFP